MPRKNITPAVKDLLRDNQRRSRARHKEFVDELQQRLRAYEQQGVQATLEMQIAARKVSEENQGLRALLASRGVAADEIQQFLKAYRPGHAGPPCVQESRPASILSAKKQDLDLPNEVGAESVSYRPPWCSKQPSPNDTLQHSSSPIASPPPNHMHCDVAASILADVHGHGDTKLARSTLGCTTDDCSVKTTHVFTIIDNAT